MSEDDHSVSLSGGFDDDFQKFLEEPLSSDDTDVQVSNKQTKNLWWLDSENERGNQVAEFTWLKKSAESAKNPKSFPEQIVASETAAGHSWLRKPSVEEKSRNASLDNASLNSEKSIGQHLGNSSTEGSKSDEKFIDANIAETSNSNELRKNLLAKICEPKDDSAPENVPVEEESLPIEENVMNISSADEMSEILAGSMSSGKEVKMMGKQITEESMAESHYSEASFDSSISKTNENKSVASQSSSETYKNTFQEDSVVSDILSKAERNIFERKDVNLSAPEKSMVETVFKPEMMVLEERELSMKESEHSNNEEDAGKILMKDTNVVLGEMLSKDLDVKTAKVLHKERDVACENAEIHFEGTSQISNEKEKAPCNAEEASINCNKSPIKVNGETRKVIISSLLLQDDKEKLETCDLKNDISVQTTVTRERDLLEKLSESQQICLEEQKKNSKLKAELISLEKEMRRKLEEQRLRLEEKSYSLQQDNIILTARIEEMELRQLTPSSRPHCDEEIASLKHYGSQLEKELKEQEHLLQGYQQENERLYSELKSAKKELKLNESKFRNRTEELVAELSRVKEQLRLRERADHFRLSQLRRSKEENSASENMQHLSNQMMHVDEIAVKTPSKEEMESLKKLLSSQHEEIQKLLKDKQELTDEVKELSKKLATFNVNEDHLERQEKEIIKLNDHITVLEKERLAEKKAYMQGQIKDHKRIKDLENQIKNMELSTRSQPRNPGKNTAGNNKQNDTNKVKYLEEQIQKLNQQLEMKDQLAKKSLLEIETQYKDIKDEYEKRMKAIEIQYCNQISLLENKLSNVEVVPEQISCSICDHPNINKIKLSKASQCTLEKAEHFIIENKELKQKLNKMALEMEALKEEYKKSTDDANQLVSAAQKEALDMISKMRSEIDDLKAEHEKSEERARTLIKNAQKEAQEMAQQLKVLHVKELQMAYSDVPTSLMHTNDALSRAADLLNKVETRDIIISQLEQKLKEWEKDCEKIQILEMKNLSLENQIKELKTALSQVQNQQTPHEREFWALKEEIEMLEERHIQREEAIQKMLFKLKQQDSTYLKNEVAKWQQRVIDKNKEIEHFRNELDVIVRCLRELKLQGITIPRPSSVT